MAQLEEVNAQWHFHWHGIDLPRAQSSEPQQFFNWRSMMLPIFRTREEFENFYQRCSINPRTTQWPGYQVFEVIYHSFPDDIPEASWAPENHFLSEIQAEIQLEHSHLRSYCIGSWGKGKGKGTISYY